MLVLLSGPSGCGKNTIIKMLLENNPNFYQLKSVTTRAMRLKDNESQGNPYYFVSNDEFQKLVDNDEFFEHNDNIHGNRYGITKQAIKQAEDPNKCVFKDIDVEGFLEYKKKLKDTDINVLSVYISLSPEDLRTRLIERGDDPENIELRLSRCEYENSFSKHYDLCLQTCNDNGSLKISKILQYELDKRMDIEKAKKQVCKKNEKACTPEKTVCAHTPKLPNR